MDNEIRLAVLIERYKAYLAQLFDKTVQEIDEYLQSLLLKHDIASLSHKEIRHITKDSNNAFLTALLAYNALLKQEWSNFVPMMAVSTHAPVKERLKLDKWASWIMRVSTHAPVKERQPKYLHYLI